MRQRKLEKTVRYLVIVAIILLPLIALLPFWKHNTMNDSDVIGTEEYNWGAQGVMDYVGIDWLTGQGMTTDEAIDYINENPNYRTRYINHFIPVLTFFQNLNLDQTGLYYGIEEVGKVITWGQDYPEETFTGYTTIMERTIYCYITWALFVWFFYLIYSVLACIPRVCVALIDKGVARVE